jgi:arylsulfatase A-like enzyme
MRQFAARVNPRTRHLLTAALGTAVALCLFARVPAQAQAPAPQPAPRPNIVLIITDDVGYGDIGSYGAPDIKTPNIDSIGRGGVRFTDFYANAPLCSPTRAGLVSGRYQQRFAVEAALGNANTAAVDQGLPSDGRSMPQLLKQGGYATALIGKWHLGYRPERSPNAHGYDYFYGYKSGYIDYYQHTGGDGQSDFFENEKPITEPGYSTDLFTEKSMRFIEQNAQGPFFLEVAYNAAHWPYQVPDRPSVAVDNARHLQPHDDSTSTRADYVAIMERADQGVGRILRTLDRLNLARNTIVIYTNDNGGEWLSSNAPLFHRKWTLWEGGIRVPTMIRWPGHIVPGRVTPQVGITMDLSASLLAAAGVSVPADTKYEGINLFPILEGKSPVVERTLYWRTLVGGFQQRAMRVGDMKLLVDGNATMVFDVRRDVGERNDLAKRQLALANKLRPMLNAWEADVDAEAVRRNLKAPPAARGAGPGRGGQPGRGAPPGRGGQPPPD